MSSYLHKPEHESGLGLVLTHGAGGNAKAHLLVRLGDAFSGAGWWVLRYDMPFRQRRPFGPPNPAGAAEDRAGLRAAVAELKTHAELVCMGGHSYGGRQASMLAAEAPDLVEALLLLSYPLHPPQKPAQLRTAHFAELKTPALFVHGTKDEFGSVDEMRRWLPAKAELQIVEGAGHDLKKGAFDLERIVAAFSALVKPN